MIFAIPRLLSDDRIGRQIQDPNDKPSGRFEQVHTPCNGTKGRMHFTVRSLDGGAR
jgi:hypothetical protein